MDLRNIEDNLKNRSGAKRMKFSQGRNSSNEKMPRNSSNKNGRN